MSSYSCQGAVTPPETPRENIRIRKHVITNSPGEGNFTPAKADDVSRASSLRLPLEKHRTPIVSVRQPDLPKHVSLQGLTTPPYAKRRKSSGTEDRPSGDACVTDGFKTPPRVSRSEVKDSAPPAAPRKVRRNLHSPVLRSSEDHDAELFEPLRKLDFGNDASEIRENMLNTPDIDWEELLKRGGSRRERNRDARKAIRLLAAHPISEGEEISVAVVRGVLGCEFTDVDSVISELRRTGCISVNRSAGTIKMLVSPQAALTNN